jgi:hypothetical protein
MWLASATVFQQGRIGAATGHQCISQFRQRCKGLGKTERTGKLHDQTVMLL